MTVDVILNKIELVPNLPIIKEGIRDDGYDYMNSIIDHSTCRAESLSIRWKLKFKTNEVVEGKMLTRTLQGLITYEIGFALVKIIVLLASVKN